ncbi:MAG TPA: hypothetical protein VF050_01640, partial [Moraxellaceae bacterium]
MDARLQEVLALLQQHGLKELPPTAPLRRLLLASEYAATVMAQHPAQAAELLLSGELERTRRPEEYVQACAALQPVDEADFMVALRQYRRREMLRWLFRDANDLCPVQELTRELSDFADAAIGAALQYARKSLVALHGEPVGEEDGLAQPLCVIGMGKLGAQELNLSSDIDLIFTFPEAGETAGPTVISNQEFFIRLGQKIIRYLDEVTADGFVFRVDMRLRPWGDGSALASSFSAMETYYERHGREWERYAL